MSDVSTPRAHHHRFATQAVPQMALTGPPKMLDLLSSPMGTPFLMDMWETVGKEVGKGARMAPDGLSCVARKLPDGRKVVVVQMPPPEREAEVHYVGILVKPESRRLLVFKEPASVRCFTLTHQGGGTTLNEQGADGAQTPLGQGPTPGVDAFVSALAGL